MRDSVSIYSQGTADTTKVYDARGIEIICTKVEFDPIAAGSGPVKVRLTLPFVRINMDAEAEMAHELPPGDRLAALLAAIDAHAALPLKNGYSDKTLYAAANAARRAA